MDLFVIVLTLLLAVFMKKAYTKANGPTEVQAPEGQDIPPLEINEVDASMLLRAKAVPRKQQGEFLTQV